MTYAEKLAAWREANPKYVGLAEKYGDLLVNTGGNDPLELVADLDLDKNMMRTNVVRFVLAVGVQSQLLVLSKTGTRAEGAPSQAEVREAVRKAGSVNDGWGGLDDSGADRVWHYLTQPADPREGEQREVECCPGKSCRTNVTRLAGQWVRGNGDLWFGPEEQD